MGDSNSTITPPPSANHFAVAGVISSVLGLFGWMLLTLLIQDYPHEIISDVLTFGWNLFVLIAGGAISGVLSLTGLLLGLASLRPTDRRMNYAAIGLGVSGLLAGVAVFLWRYMTVTGS